MIASVEVKSILNKKKKTDSWFLDDYTINAYSACSFNCLYCYIRGSKYGINMEEELSVKSNAVELLEKQLSLRAKKNQYGVIVMSSATDPYLQAENDLLMTRNLLEVILKCRFPVHVITKSDLVERDFDLLEKIKHEAILPQHLKDKVKDGVFITFSFSTVNDAVAKIFEPGATAPSLRIQTLKKASQAGFTTGVSLMPLLPFITDTTEHLEEMYVAFGKANAQYILAATLTLFGNEKYDSKQLMLRAIEKHYPHLLAKYKNWFEKSNSMPAYYNKAFYKKSLKLCSQFGLRNTIIV
jgi:DNA repair photolyase